MAIYFVGDIQGCYDELNALLTKVGFSKTHDYLYVAGDLVARGPDSLKTLRLLKSLGGSVKTVLGNHDLHLLAINAGIKKAKPSDKLQRLLVAPDRDELLFWLSQQPLIQKLPNEETYMTHAGIPPHWSPEQAVKYANKAHKKISSSEQHYWLKNMYGEKPNNWSKASNSLERFRYTINALTRMRYCHSDGSLDFDCKNTPENTINELTPWFELSQLDSKTQWIFGHWAALLGKCSQKNIYALDTGCVWGHHLTMLRWNDKKLFIEQSHKL